MHDSPLPNPTISLQVALIKLWAVLSPLTITWETIKYSNNFTGCLQLSDHFLESDISLKEIVNNWFQNYLLRKISVRIKQFPWNSVWVIIRNFICSYIWNIQFKCNTQENKVTIYNITTIQLIYLNT